MALGIDDLYDDDDDSIVGQNQDLNDDNHLDNNSDLNDNHQESSLIEDFLKTRGIDDLNKIRFEDEQGNIEERSWDTLSKEEQFNILNTPLSFSDNLEQDNYGLTNLEIDLLNKIRESNLSPEEYLQLFLGQQTEPLYKIDDLSDDEIYLLDLEDRVGELSDEDAALALSIAKLNENLFLKLVEGIRKEYKEREEERTKFEEALKEQEEQEIYDQFKGSVIGAIKDFNNIGSFDLNFDDNDRNELALFMLERDETGNNYLWQALLEPETLVKAAWFILNGEEAFESISDYFTSLMKQVAETLYKKGLEDGKKGVSAKPTVVINKNKGRQSYNSVEDLLDDDDD